MATLVVMEEDRQQQQQQQQQKHLEDMFALTSAATRQAAARGSTATTTPTTTQAMTTAKNMSRRRKKSSGGVHSKSEGSSSKSNRSKMNELVVTVKTEPQTAPIPVAEEPYSYAMLLERCVALQAAADKTERYRRAGERGGFMLTAPDMRRRGRRTEYRNFEVFCREIDREPRHLVDFLSKALEKPCTLARARSSGSGNNNSGSNSATPTQSLYIVGACTSRHMQMVLRRYIEGYVQCETCKSLNTSLAHHVNQRMMILSCADCNASRFVLTPQRMLRAAGL